MRGHLVQEPLPPCLAYLPLPFALLQGTDFVSGEICEDPARAALLAAVPLASPRRPAVASAVRALRAQVTVVKTVQLRRQPVVARQHILHVRVPRANTHHDVELASDSRQQVLAKNK